MRRFRRCSETVECPVRFRASRGAAGGTFGLALTRREASTAGGPLCTGSWCGNEGVNKDGWPDVHSAEVAETDWGRAGALCTGS